ncbi:MAG: galactose ABC transporter substrate-binding protein [Ruthenibacterium lactatiformans]
MKKVLAILLAACLALSLAACGGSGSSAPVSTAPDTSGSAPASAPAAADGSIAVFYYTYSDTYISTVRTALDAELDKLGVEYQDYDSNSQQNTQTEQVDTAITKGATCLIVNIVETGSDDAAQGIVDKAKAADIPVIFFNREVSDAVVNSYEKCAFIGTDAAEAGHMQGQMIADYLLANYDDVDLNGDGTISYVMFKGQNANPEAEYRTQYAVEDRDAALRPPGKPALTFYDANNADKFLVDRNGTWSAQASNEYMTTILSEYTEANNNMVELVICNNDGMAEGAITALKTAGYNASADKAIPVFGVDATDAAKELIAAGSMVGSIKQDAEGMAAAIALLAKNATSGAALMDGTDSYNVDDASAKIRIPYAVYTG